MADTVAASEKRFGQFCPRDADLVRWRFGEGYVAELTEQRYRAMFHGGRRILDVGCGVGAAATWAEGAEYFGIDLSEAFVREGQSNTQNALVVASALRLPFPDECFDRVICVGVLHHLSRDAVPLAIAEMARVLARGETMAILEPNPWNPAQRLFAYASPAERGILHTSPTAIRRAAASAPEVMLETFMYVHQPALFSYLTFALRRWRWIRGPRMTRLLMVLHRMTGWLTPGSLRAMTCFYLRKKGAPGDGAAPAGWRA